MYGLSYRDGRCTGLFLPKRLSKLSDCLMDCGDEIGKLIRSQPIMAQVAPDDLRGEIRIVSPDVHDHFLAKKFSEMLICGRSKQGKRGQSHNNHQLFGRRDYMTGEPSSAKPVSEMLTP